MSNIPEIERKLENIVRPGSIFAVDPATARCRVESGNLKTDWLPWLALRAGSDRTWWPPSEGEQVVLLCPGGNPANGLVLLGLYSDENPAPSGSLQMVILALMRDGSRITYDNEAHHLHADLAGSATLATAGDVLANVGGNLTASAAGNASVSVAGDLTAVAATATVTAAQITLNGIVTINGALQLSGPLTAAPGPGGGGATFTGNIGVTGAVNIVGDLEASKVTSNGVTLDTHTHTSTTPGNQTSAPTGGT